MIRFLITIPRDLHGELKETAAQRGQTLTGLIRGILCLIIRGRQAGP